MDPIQTDEATVLTVAQVSRRIKMLLEDAFPQVRVRGEVTGYKKAVSGHAYFSLAERDAGGQTLKLDCVLYKFARASARVLRDGDLVVATGRLTAWAGASRYQFVVEHLEDAGEGDLLRRLEALKRRLEAEGLFDPARKVPLPFLPRRVGVVTSLRGAALRDILRTLWSRYPVPVVVADTLVQGDGAAAGIAAGIAILDALDDVDVLIVGRGGGSLEDLWAFNEEVVVRAVAACRTPIVSAVGHEVDHVLSDDAADERAATPTAAAQRVVPAMADLRAGLAEARGRLAQGLVRRIEVAGQRTDEAASRLASAGARLLDTPQHRLDVVGHRLAARHPARTLAEERRRASVLATRLRTAGLRLLDPTRSRLDALGLRLRPCSPFAPLARGYALARTPQGGLINRFDQVSPGGAIEVLLGTGALDCSVDSVRSETSPVRTVRR